MVSVSEPNVKNLCGEFESDLQSSLSPEGQARVDGVLNNFLSLNNDEKLVCLLKIMTDSAVAGHSNLFDYDSGAESNVAAGVFSVSAFQVSNQVEQGYAFTWIKSHLEEDPTTCLRKDEVYEDYKSVSSCLIIYQCFFINT